MTTEESREVAEARDAILDDSCSLDPPCEEHEGDVDRLIEAVRKDERRRLGVEEGWERGVI